MGDDNDDDSEVKLVTLDEGAFVQQWQVKRQLGEGGCGVVYLVENTKSTDKSKKKGATEDKFAALKVEPLQKNKEDEILKMEAHVLKLLQGKKHVCKLFLCGRAPTYNFMVMSLLGDNLGDMRKTTPEQRFTSRTAIGITIQCLQALQDMHYAGFTHRDIKPSNFALGWRHSERDRRTVFLFDFGLARQFLMPGKDMAEKWQVREPRRNVAFRGTVRYCSPNVHRRFEQGPNDDLWSLLYMAVELITGKLPWRGNDRERTKKAKDNCTDKELLEKCPPEFYPLYTEVKKLDYKKKPPYESMRRQLRLAMTRKGFKDSMPFDWEAGGRYEKYFSGDASESSSTLKERDERRRKDKQKGDDHPTVSEADELEDSNRKINPVPEVELADSDTTRGIKNL